MYQCVLFFLCRRVREITWNLSFTASQTSLDKSLCDWLRAIVVNQSEDTKHTTLGPVLEYKYKD